MSRVFLLAVLAFGACNQEPKCPTCPQAGSSASDSIAANKATPDPAIVEPQPAGFSAGDFVPCDKYEPAGAEFLVRTPVGIVTYHRDGPARMLLRGVTGPVIYDVQRELLWFSRNGLEALDLRSPCQPAKIVATGAPIGEQMDFGVSLGKGEHISSNSASIQYGVDLRDPRPQDGNVSRGVITINKKSAAWALARAKTKPPMRVIKTARMAKTGLLLELRKIAGNPDSFDCTAVLPSGMVAQEQSSALRNAPGACFSGRRVYFDKSGKNFLAGAWVCGPPHETTLYDPDNGCVRWLDEEIDQKEPYDLGVLGWLEPGLTLAIGARDPIGG